MWDDDENETIVFGAVLSAGTLARFLPGLKWPAILDIDDFKTERWWRVAVAEAESRGLLAWDRKRRAWCLTDAARGLVREVS